MSGRAMAAATSAGCGQRRSGASRTPCPPAAGAAAVAGVVPWRSQSQRHLRLRQVQAAADDEGVPGAGAVQPPPPVGRAASGAAAAASATGLPASRLQQEVALLAALDCEFTHLQLLGPAGAAGGRRHISLPAEVCVVDAEGRVLLHSLCNPLEGRLAEEPPCWRHIGGVPPSAWQGAPTLAALRLRLEQLLAGRLLVGHHLAKDLTSLGLQHPAAALRDTLRYRELQGRGGAGRRLRDLSAERLGREIQPSGRRHCPREDAVAAMDLYLQMHFQPQYMRYDDLVQRELAELLSGGAGGGSGGGGGSSSEEAGEDPAG